jgi:phytoene dehydrogenase-like protein
MQPLVDAGFDLVDGLLSPLALPPRHPVTLARYGRFGIRSAASLSRVFATDEASALLAGLAGHSMLPLSAASTAGYGLFLGMLGHLVGWPVARGGSQSIADALVSLLSSLGGNVECGWEVQSLDELPPSRAVLADVTPRQLLAIAGNRLPARYRKKLQRFRYGPGVHKVDWVLDGPVPWLSPACHAAGTVHVGGAFEQVAAAEEEVSRGRHPERPFVLLVQPSQCDGTRSPTGMHVVWAYCHVPNGSTVDMTERIEAQIERFAPGFRDRILARHVMGPAAMQAHNPNYVGGDINGGLADLRQFVARPTFGLHPWATPVAGLYLCSSSTPPGGGVHGMCGWHAAKEVLRHQK